MDDNASSSRNARLSRDVPPTRPQRLPRPPRSQRAQRSGRSPQPRPTQQQQQQQQQPLQSPQPPPSRRPRERTAIPAQRSASLMRKVRAGLSKKLKFFTELMGHLDMIIYAELCTLYYMECSLFRLLLRAVPQSLFLSPKPDEFMLITPAHRPHVLAVAVPNVLCMLVHLLWRPLQGTEASRGYLHGGVLIDFVGQRAPSSRWALLVVDVVVLAVQCLMLAVHTEREKLRKLVLPMKGALALAATARATATATATATTTATTNALVAAAQQRQQLRQQDLDAEERGVEVGGTTGDDADGFEMQPLSGVEGVDGVDGVDSVGDGDVDNVDNVDNDNDDNDDDMQDDGRPRRLPPEQAAEYVLNALASGCNLSDFYVVHAIREASRKYQGVAAQSLHTMGLAATAARMFRGSGGGGGGGGVRAQTTGTQ